MARDKDDPRLRVQIDENLKRVYDEALEQEVPDRFTQLLEQLRNADKRRRDEDAK